MLSEQLNYIAQIARFIICFTWVYHGIAPKLLHVAPIEQQLTAGFGFSVEISYWITKVAGLSEVIFGLVFWIFYRNRLLNYLNIAAMIALIGFSSVLLPPIIIDGFNPITTNLPIIGFSLVLLKLYQE